MLSIVSMISLFSFMPTAAAKGFNFKDFFSETFEI